MKNRKLLIGLAVLLLLGSFSVMAFAMQTSASDLLVQSLDLAETVESGHAVISVSADVPEQSGTATVEVWGQLEFGPNGEPAMRLEVLEATLTDMDGMDLVGTTAVTDGTQFWLYSPAKNEVIVGTFEEVAAEMERRYEEGEFDHDEFEQPEFDEGDQPEMPENAEEAVALLLEYFTAERAGRADIGSNAANTVRLIPIPEQMPDEVRAAGGLINVWVRMDDSAFVGAEYTGSALGEARMEVTTLELNTAIDPALFSFDVPEGVEIINFADLEFEEWDHSGAAAPAEFELVAPATLIEGAELSDTRSLRGTIVQQYTLGDGQFSFAQGVGNTAVPQDAFIQTVTVQGVDGTLYTNEAGDRTLLSWQLNGISYWIGGDLTPDQALAFAESLE